MTRRLGNYNFRSNLAKVLVISKWENEQSVTVSGRKKSFQFSPTHHILSQGLGALSNLGDKDVSQPRSLTAADRSVQSS